MLIRLFSFAVSFSLVCFILTRSNLNGFGWLNSMIALNTLKKAHTNYTYKRPNWTRTKLWLIFFLCRMFLFVFFFALFLFLFNLFQWNNVLSSTESVQKFKKISVVHKREETHNNSWYAHTRLTSKYEIRRGGMITVYLLLVTDLFLNHWIWIVSFWM